MLKAMALIRAAYFISSSLLVTGCLVPSINITPTNNNLTGNGGGGNGRGGENQILSSLAWSVPTPTLIIGNCQSVTINSENSGGTITPLSGTTTINLSSGGSGLFYSGSDCTGTAITSTSITSGSSSVTLSFRDNYAETPTLSATASGLTTGTDFVIVLPTSYAYVVSSSSVYLCAADASGNLSNCADAVNDGSDSSWGSPSAITFLTIGANTYAYVTDDSYGDGHVWICSVVGDRSLSACVSNNANVSSSAWAPTGITLGSFTVGGASTTYAYVSDDANYDGNIWKCSIDTLNGTFTSCAVSNGNNTSSSWTALSVSLKTLNGATYAYVGDQNGELWLCTMNSSGDLNTCANALNDSSISGIWDPQNLFFTTIGGAQYVYVADSSDSQSIYLCSVDTANGTVGSCNADNGGAYWLPYGVALATFNGGMFAYVAGSYDDLKQCSVDNSGVLSSCSSAPSSNAPYWTPTKIIFAPPIYNGVATKLAWSEATAIQGVSTCETYTVDVEANNGGSTIVSSSTNVTLSGGGSGSFYSGDSCTGSPTTSVTIAANTSGVTFSYEAGSTAGTLTLSAAAASGLSSATESVTVSTTSNSFVIDTNEVYLCKVLDANGEISTCSDAYTGGSEPEWSPYGTALKSFSGSTYLYVADNGDNDYSGGYAAILWQCTVDPTSGALTSCSNAVTDTSDVSGWDLAGVTFATFGSPTATTYAYLSDYNGNVWQCTAASNGTLSSCSTIVTSSDLSPAISWEPNSITFQVASNGNTYAYVGDFYLNNVWQCQVNTTSGLMPGGCTATGGTEAGDWAPQAMAFESFNSTLYAYVADQNGSLWQCAVETTGVIDSCSSAIMSGQTDPNWRPTGITFETLNGTVFAYISDGHYGTGNIWQCSVDSSNTGKLSDCVTTNGGQTWAPQASMIFP
jgi:hypothetical protein